MEVLTDQIPRYHFENLKKIENGYWWFEGRLIWAKAFLLKWLEENYFIDPVFYADLGSGTGGFGKALQHQFAFEKTLLIDKVDAPLKSMPPLEGITQIDADLESDFSLPFSPNFVTCMDLIEHLKEDEQFLKRLFEQMKPGGLLIISVPAHSFLYSSWDTTLGHHRRYSKKLLMEKLIKAGFKIRKADYIWSFLFPFAPYRLFFSKQQKNLNYPEVPQILNQLLILLTRWECQLPRWIPFPFGTSLFVSATKE